MVDQILQKKFEDYFLKFDTYKKREANAALRNKNELGQLVDDINKILEENNATSIINSNQVAFKSAQIHNIFIADKGLSDVLFDTCYPIPSEKVFSHYTRACVCTNIISSRTLRLYNLHKNHAAGEFKEFYLDHQIYGFSNGGSLLSIPTDDETIMSDTFCLCFTGFGLDRFDTAKWRDFADFGKGIRMDFEVIPRVAEFRKVYYPSKAKAGIPLMKQLFNDIPLKYSLPLNFTRISKIGSYYIRNDYTSENEYRFLLKRTADEYNAWNLKPIADIGKVSYVTIAFNSPYADFKLVSIQPGYDFPVTSIDELKELVQRLSPWTTVLDKAIDFSQY